jgi:hypothetical protein
MTLEAGWLNRQLDEVRNDVEQWPEWMKEAAIFASGRQDDPKTKESRACVADDAE